MKKRFLSKTVCSSVLAICLLAQPCWAVFESADTSEVSEGVSEGEGMLSPPSRSSEGSVFGSDAVSDGVKTDEKLENILSELAFPANNGRWSVYICDLEKNTEGSIQDGQMQAASLIKLYIMGAVFDAYDEITQQYGEDVIYADLYSMITVSDNDAANTLVSCLGGGDEAAGMAAVNSYCTAHGYNDTHMGRLLLHSSEYDDNYTSVSDCGHFLRNIYEGNADADEKCMTQFSLLADQTRRNKIPAQMPADVRVANKTGELADVENDAGIVYDSMNDLILVFMSEDLTEVGAAQETIAALSRQIYDSYS